MILKTSNLNLILNNKIILKDINFTLNDNDRVGVIGKNGAGKTMFLRSIAGIYHFPKENLIKNNYFYFISNPNLLCLPNLNSFENLNRTLMFFNHLKIDQEEINNLFRIFEMDKYYHIRFKHLSQGYKLRLQMIIFLTLNFDNLIIDEFITFFDKKLQDKISGLIDDKYSNLKSLIVASHNEKLIEKYCNRIVEIDRGSIVKDEKIIKK